MSEAMALFRFAILRQRTLLIVMLAWIATFSVVFLSVSWLSSLSNLLGILFFIGMFLPILISTFLLFEYDFGADLNTSASGISRWLLRQPIPAWKIAVVPIVLRLVWITSLCLLACGLIYVWKADGRSHQGENFAAAILTINASSIWLLGLNWRPFRYSVSRVFSLLLVGCAMIGSFMMIGFDAINNSIVATPLSLLFLGLGIAFSFDAIRLARSNSWGIDSKRLSSRWVPTVYTEPINISGTLSRVLSARGNKFLMLAWHDFFNGLQVLIKSIFWVLPISYVTAALIIGYDPVAITLVLIVTIIMFILGSQGFVPLIKSNSLPSLPIYLAAGPVRSDQIAWTRLFIGIAYGFIVTTIFAIFWAFWNMPIEHRDILLLQFSRIPGSLPTTSTLQLSLLIVTAVFVFGTNAMMTEMWLRLSGRTYLVVGFTLAIGVLCASVVLAICLWFISTSNIATAKSDFARMATFLPTVVICLLAVKLFSAILAAIFLLRQRVSDGKSLLLIAGVWIVAVASFSTILVAVPVFEQQSLLSMIVLTAIAIPLVRVLTSPLMLNWDRHRS